MKVGRFFQILKKRAGGRLDMYKNPVFLYISSRTYIKTIHVYYNAGGAYRI